jgi:arsenate reductase (thioredoxin)
MQVLFICRGNVGRSQMGEYIFNSLSTPEHRAISAGTRVVDKQGNSVDGDRTVFLDLGKPVIDSLAEIGIDASSAVRTQLTEEILNQSEAVVSMAEPETMPDFLKDRSDVIYWEVADPKGMNLEETRKIRDEIGLKVKDLLTKF